MNETEIDVYSLHRPLRRTGTFVKAVDPERRPPLGYVAVPGYIDLIVDVRCGRAAPPWGTEYVLLDGESIPDFADASAEQFAVSEALRAILEEAGVNGLHFSPILVDGHRTMFILGIEGCVELRGDPPEFVLLNGAEIGLFKRANSYISARVAKLIRAANLDLEVTRAEPSFSDLSG